MRGEGRRRKKNMKARREYDRKWKKVRNRRRTGR